jgi:putative SOS response-associated peptidase YedK
MCGRFTLKAAAMSLKELFDLADVPTLPLRYNIAPTQNVAAVRQISGQPCRELTMLRWGLIPSWAKDRTIGNRLINARADTVAEKPSFRSAYRQRRCLVVADGFYEWMKDNGKKQPYYIRLADGSPFAIAGLWEHWQGADGEIIDSCTLLTTEANDLMRPIHERMPVILPRQAYAQWLDPTVQRPEQIAPLLKPYPSEELIAGRVGMQVNNPRNEESSCVEPIT